MTDTATMSNRLDKTKPISNRGNASMITYLRRGKNCCATALEETSENT